MRLFLASTFANSVRQFYERQHGGRVLFCANPADPFSSKYWVKKDYDAFKSYDFPITRVDLRKIDAVELEVMLKEFQIFHVCGGSAIHMIDLLHKKKMDTVIIAAIANGLIYTGTSAGSIIMAPDISFGADDRDEHEARMAGKVRNLKGLGLAPFFLMCHCQDKYFLLDAKRAIKRLPQNRVPVLFVNDGQAIWCQHGKFEIVGV